MVASLEAGFRQDRAADMASGLERRIAPEELAPLVGARVEENLEGVGAPAVLERLVGSESLPRRKAWSRAWRGAWIARRLPLELDERVLESAAASPTGGAFVASQSSWELQPWCSWRCGWS